MLHKATRDGKPILFKSLPQEIGGTDCVRVKELLDAGMVWIGKNEDGRIEGTKGKEVVPHFNDLSSLLGYDEGKKVEITHRDDFKLDLINEYFRLMQIYRYCICGGFGEENAVEQICGEIFARTNDTAEARERGETAFDEIKKYYEQHPDELRYSDDED